MAAWSLVSKTSVQGTGANNVITSAGINTVGADVIWVAAATYGGAPSNGDGTLIDSPDGTFTDTPNVWPLIGATQSGGDAGLVISTWRCISPTTGSGHKFRIVPTVGGTANYPSFGMFALTQGSAPSYVTSVAGATGGIGNANDLVLEAIGFYVNNGYSISGSFNDLTEVSYAAATSMGLAAAWKHVTGSVTPTWTPSGSNTEAMRADSFTGTDAPGGGGGGGGGKPTAYYALLRGM